jgi:hypothetical protein
MDGSSGRVKLGGSERGVPFQRLLHLPHPSTGQRSSTIGEDDGKHRETHSTQGRGRGREEEDVVEAREMYSSVHSINLLER